jgi:hypothetical protein
MNIVNFIEIIKKYDNLKGEGVTMDITFGSKEDDTISVRHGWTIEMISVLPHLTLVRVKCDDRPSGGTAITCYFEPSSVTSIVINED